MKLGCVRHAREAHDNSRLFTQLVINQINLPSENERRVNIFSCVN